MTGMGRKKTQMKNQGTDARQVAPPRRRSGIFKKYGELTTLCAVEAALVILSADGKAVSYGHHGADPVINNFAPTGKPDSGSTQFTLADHEANLQALEKKYHRLLEQLEAEKKLGEKLQEIKMRDQQLNGRRLWDIPADELNLEELLTLDALLDEVKEKALKALAERSAKTSAPTEGSSVVDPNGHGTGPGN